MKEIRYRPTPTAERIHADPHAIIGVFGPWGSGKSTIALWDILLHCQRNPKADILVVRDTYPALKDSCVTAWKRLFGELGELRQGPPPDFHWSAGNLRGKILFRSADDPREIMKFQSLEVGGAWLEECAPGLSAEGKRGQGLPQEIFAGVFARIRQPDCARRMICTSLLPPSQKHWLYQLFYDRRQRVEGFAQDQATEFTSLLARYQINPEENKEHLPPLYYETVASLLKSQDQIDRFIYGKVGSSYGGFSVYPTYRDAVHRDERCQVQAGPMLRGWDGGLKPACVWAQVTGAGRLRVLGELQAEHEGIETFADAVTVYGNQHFGPRVYTDFGDETLRNGDQGSGRSAVDYLRVKKIILRLVKNDIEARIQAVRAWLSKLGSDGPLLTFHPRCELLIEGLRGGYRFQEVGGVATETPKKDVFSHVHDCLQYVCLGLRGQSTVQDHTPLPVKQIDHLGTWPRTPDAITTYRTRRVTHRGVR